MTNLIWAVNRGLTRTYVSDVAVYYGAASIGLRYGWAHLYDPAAQKAVWQLLGIQQNYPLIQPPTSAWLFTPLLVFPLPAVFDVWALLMLAAIVVAWWLVASGTWAIRLLQLAAVLSLYGIAAGLGVGQIVFLVICLVAVSWWLIRHDHPVWAGVVLVALVVKPQPALLVPFALALAGYRKTFVTWLIGSGLVGAVMVVIMTPPGMVDMLDRMKEVSATPWVWATVPGMTFVGLFGSGLPATVLEGIAAVTALYIAWRRRGEGPEIPMAAALVGSLLVTPYLHEPEMISLVLAAYLYMRAETNRLSFIFPIALYAAAQMAHLHWIHYYVILVLEAAWLISMVNPVSYWERRVVGAGFARPAEAPIS